MKDDEESLRRWRKLTAIGLCIIIAGALITLYGTDQLYEQALGDNAYQQFQKMMPVQSGGPNSYNQSYDRYYALQDALRQTEQEKAVAESAQASGVFAIIIGLFPYLIAKAQLRRIQWEVFLYSFRQMNSQKENVE